MAKEKITIHEAPLKTNCPECFTQEGLHLAFVTEEEKTRLIYRSKGELSSVMRCQKCENTIYPERWTDDIERLYEYHRKLAGSPRAFFRMRPLAILLIVGILFAGIAAALFFQRPELFR
ncbi:hypothetical protein [Croceiramulus getboli]|nr:hypothetical protein P8624_06250 [Flavobacteriaceae bacterium YJPT1-3]